MQEPIRYYTLHLESPPPVRYRQIAVVEQAGQFELLIFEDTFLRRDQLTSVGRQDWISARFYPTLNAADYAADEEKRKSLADGWILIPSVER
jgi:hypothetical protein